MLLLIIIISLLASLLLVIYISDAFIYVLLPGFSFVDSVRWSWV